MAKNHTSYKENGPEHGRLPLSACASDKSWPGRLPPPRLGTFSLVVAWVVLA